MQTSYCGEIDLDRLSAAIQAKRGRTGLRAAAADVGVSPPTLSRIENGRLPDIETYLKVCRWLNLSPQAFAINRSDSPRASHLQEIEMHLRADKTLPKETAEALSKMVRLAYEAVKNGRL